MALHTGIAEFPCGECGQAFITQDKLMLHQKSRHSNERPHSCEWCGKGFLLSHKLADHRRRVHTGEKPFKCNKCEQRFTDSSALSHHRKRHADEQEAVIVTNGGVKEEFDSEDEAAAAVFMASI